MPIYEFIYKKRIKAEDLNKAILKEKKTKPVFDSLIQIDEPVIKEKTSAIGFEYEVYDDDE